MNGCLNTALFSDSYQVTTLQEEDIPAVFALCRKNELYYQYCPPMVTMDSIRSDLHALPTGAEMSQKYDVGYYQNGRLVAIMDLITGWTEERTVWIGLFMVDVSCQRKNAGTKIIHDLKMALKQAGFEMIQLGWMQGNPQAEHFWKKNGFVPLDIPRHTSRGDVIIAQYQY